MKRLVVAVALSLILATSAQAGHRKLRDSRACLIEVLYSEELPIAPLFYHTVKAALLVTPPDAAPFETTVQEVIPWQVPPPRRGQRVRVTCDSGISNSVFGAF